jgi:hypothetical protein
MRHGDPPHPAPVSSLAVGTLFTHLSLSTVVSPKNLAERRENQHPHDGRPDPGPPGINHFVPVSSQPQIENYAPLASVRVTSFSFTHTACLTLTAGGAQPHLLKAPPTSSPEHGRTFSSRSQPCAS